MRIRELVLSQGLAARRLELRQPDVSRLMNGRHAGFSAERLIRVLNALGADVQIVVTKKSPRSRRGGKVGVVAA